MKPGKQINLIGKVFGRLTVIEFDCYKKATENSKTKRSYYICKCECGNTISSCSHFLNTGSAKSCGCLKVDCGKKYGAINGLKLGKIESSFNDLYLSYKSRDKKYKRDFSLTKEQFRYLTKQNCHYCNCEPS